MTDEDVVLQQETLLEIVSILKRIEAKMQPTIVTLPSEGKSDVHCNEHGILMEQKWSEKKQKNYLVHRNEEGKPCFGKGYLTS